MNNNLKQCPHCQGSGTRMIQTDEDEYDLDICDCGAGIHVLSKSLKELNKSEKSL